jgi:hypothetical protein
LEKLANVCRCPQKKKGRKSTRLNRRSENNDQRQREGEKGSAWQLQIVEIGGMWQQEQRNERDLELSN